MCDIYVKINTSLIRLYYQNMIKFLILFHILKTCESEEKYEGTLRYLSMIKLRATLRDRFYLTSNCLQPFSETAWYYLYMHGSDQNFLSVTSLPRSDFNELLVVFSEHYTVMSGLGKSGRPARLLHKHGALGYLIIMIFIQGMLLHFYNGRMDQKTLCEIFGMPPSTQSRVLRNAEVALGSALLVVRDARIFWPTSEEQIEWSNRVTMKFDYIINHH